MLPCQQPHKCALLITATAAAVACVLSSWRATHAQLTMDPIEVDYNGSLLVRCWSGLLLSQTIPRIGSSHWHQTDGSQLSESVDGGRSWQCLGNLADNCCLRNDADPHHRPFTCACGHPRHPCSRGARYTRHVQQARIPGLKSDDDIPFGSTLVGSLVVAARGMHDAHLARTVVLIGKHSPDFGSLGLVINRIDPHTLREALPELEQAQPGHPTVNRLLFAGGPVARGRLFFLFRCFFHDNAARVLESTFLGADSALLSERLAATSAGADDQSLRVFSGHVAWGAGQLQREITRGDWHVHRLSEELLWGSSRDTLTAAGDRLWGQLLDVVQGPCAASSAGVCAPMSTPSGHPEHGSDKDWLSIKMKNGGALPHVPLKSEDTVAVTSYAKPWRQSSFIISMWAPPPATLDPTELDSRTREVAAANFTTILDACCAPTLDTVQARIDSCERAGLTVIAARVDAHPQSIPAVRDSPALVGWQLKDEPFYDQFSGMATYLRGVRDAHPSKVGFINLLPNDASGWCSAHAPNCTAANITYDEYVRRFVAEVGMRAQCSNTCVVSIYLQDSPRLHDCRSARRFCAQIIILFFGITSSFHGSSAHMTTA